MSNIFYFFLESLLLKMKRIQTLKPLRYMVYDDVVVIVFDHDITSLSTAKLTQAIIFVLGLAFCIKHLPLHQITKQLALKTIESSPLYWKVP